MAWKWQLAVKETVEAKRKPDGSKWTQKEIAEALGTSQHVLSDLYRLHHTRLDATSIARIAAFLDVSWTDLVVGLVDDEALADQ
ncbi:MAG: helix-turn-helix domain-containing protein [Chloroflexota bacterium]|nr:helix-turn-helix domain-containing protein [Chloroflexota bacterium]